MRSRDIQFRVIVLAFLCAGIFWLGVLLGALR